MDLTSIRLLEETLAELDCALLLASHDEAFLSTLSDPSDLSDLSFIEWTIEGRHSPYSLKVRL
jgi:hypothetical protein